jgi:hypothetical protein
MFTDDLLRSDDDRTTARCLFPELFHVLDHEEMGACLSRVEWAENEARARSLRDQLLPLILFGIASLGAGIIWAFGDVSHASTIAISSMAAAIDATSMIMIIRTLKNRQPNTNWLNWRILAERLRQFHFQSFVCRTNDILMLLLQREHMPKRFLLDRFLYARAQWLSEFKSRLLKGGPQESDKLVSKHHMTVWLHSPPVLPDERVLNALPDEFFDAYKVLRIMHQANNAQLRLEHFHFQPIRSELATIFLVIAQILLIASVTPSALLSSPPMGWAICVAICFALLTLCVFTIEHFLNRKREFDHIRRYLSLVQELLERFETGFRYEKFQVMIEMDRLAFEQGVIFRNPERRVFLPTRSQPELRRRENSKMRAILGS